MNNEINIFIQLANTNNLKTKELKTQIVENNSDIIGNFHVTVSFGKGNVTNIPWISVSRFEDYKEDGPVFLYYKNKNVLILSFGVKEEATKWNNEEIEPKYNFRWNNEIRSKYETIEDFIGERVERYGNSYVFKSYSVDGNNLVQSDSLDEDLVEMLKIYLQQLPELSLVDFIKKNYQDYENKFADLIQRERQQFVDSFPLENLNNMTLDEYSQTGNKESFTNYIENKTSNLCSGSLGVNQNKIFYPKDDEYLVLRTVDKCYSEFDTVEKKFEQFKKDLNDFVTGFDINGYVNLNIQKFRANVIKFKVLRLYRKDIKLYGFPSHKEITKVLKKLDLNFDQKSDDSILQNIVLTKYLIDQYPEIVNLNTDIINRLIWDYKSRYIESNDNSGEEEQLMSIVCNIDSTINSGINQLILTGAPGTGKTYSAKKYVQLKLGEEYLSSKQYGFVQFHPSYDYTDFIEGIRPIEESGVVKFVKMDGIFKSFCRRAAEDTDPNNKYYFIIDEINRADLSKVFGEIMFCLEEDYRGIDGKVSTQYQNMTTYKVEKDIFEHGFFIPKNIILIGTMNDIDRSVESFDFALRRRFRWIQIKVSDILEESLNSMWNKPIFDGLIESINSLNNVISGELGKKLGLDENYHVGPAYFKENNVVSVHEYLENVWSSRVEPLLREYVRGRKADIVETFINDCKAALLSTR